MVPVENVLWQTMGAYVRPALPSHRGWSDGRRSLCGKPEAHSLPSRKGVACHPVYSKHLPGVIKSIKVCSVSRMHVGGKQLQKYLVLLVSFLRELEGSSLDRRSPPIPQMSPLCSRETVSPNSITEGLVEDRLQNAPSGVHRQERCGY